MPDLAQLKGVTEDLLCRFPHLYKRVLKLKSPDTIEKRLYLSLVRPGDVVVEGGANRGFYTRLFCRLVGKGGEVHAFEPFPATFEKLKAATADCKKPPCFINQAGLGEAPGDFDFNMPGTDDGHTSLRPHSFGAWENEAQVTVIKCRVTTLDEYAAEVGLKRLNFVKLDIEGAELPALRGGRKTLAQFQPILVFELCATWMTNFGLTAADVLAELTALGYRKFWTQRDTVARIASADLAESFSQAAIDPANIVAVPEAVPIERVEQMLRDC